MSFKTVCRYLNENLGIRKSFLTKKQMKERLNFCKDILSRVSIKDIMFTDETKIDLGITLIIQLDYLKKPEKKMHMN